MRIYPDGESGALVRDRCGSGPSWSGHLTGSIGVDSGQEARLDLRAANIEVRWLDSRLPDDSRKHLVVEYDCLDAEPVLSLLKLSTSGLHLA